MTETTKTDCKISDFHVQLRRLLDEGAAEVALALLFAPEADSHRLDTLRRFADAFALDPDLGTDRVRDRIRVVDVALDIARGRLPDLLCARDRAHSLAHDFAQRRDYARFRVRKLDLNRRYDLNQAQNQARAMARLRAYAQFLAVALGRIVESPSYR